MLTWLKAWWKPKPKQKQKQKQKWKQEKVLEFLSTLKIVSCKLLTRSLGLLTHSQNFQAFHTFGTEALASVYKCRRAKNLCSPLFVLFWRIKPDSLAPCSTRRSSSARCRTSRPRGRASARCVAPPYSSSPPSSRIITVAAICSKYLVRART